MTILSFDVVQIGIALSSLVFQVWKHFKKEKDNQKDSKQEHKDDPKE